jgi:hypothetical protein
MKKTRKNQRFNESKSIDIELMGYRACYKNGKRVPCSKKKTLVKHKTFVKQTNTNTYKNNNNNILNVECSKNGKKIPCNKLKFF